MLFVVVTVVACTKSAPASSSEQGSAASATQAAPNAPPPRKSGQNTVVDIALGSKEHTTLVAALGAAEYVDSLDNPGPFTVFAPTNAAFDKLPKGTVEALVKPEKKDDLRNILKYHVTVSVYPQKSLTDGMVLAMANGAKVTVHVSNGTISVNDAHIVASVSASNGIVHVIDGVLLPPSK